MATKEDPPKLSIQALKAERAKCLGEIKHYERVKDDRQKQLVAYPHHTSEWLSREELIKQVMGSEAQIELYREALAHYEAQLMEIEALTNVKNRNDFSIVTKRECVDYSILSGTMSGFAGSGKSHTLAMITGEKPPSIRISTPLNEIPVRTITQTRMGVTGNRFLKISDDNYTEKVLMTAKEGVDKLRPRGITSKMKVRVHNLLHKPPEPSDPVEKELIVKYYSLDDGIESLEGQVIVEISDCGGQPQFLEILPRFIESIDFSILVTNLSQSFDSYPINYYYNKEGCSVGNGVPSPLSNEQVLRLCLQMIASLSQGGKPVKFAFVGTHRDLEGKCDNEGVCFLHKAGDCLEPREEKNRRLREMVESFGLQDHVICKNPHEYIFAINAKSPDEIDHQIVDELRERILEDCHPRTISIPVSYHAVELTLKKKARESGHIAFSESTMLLEVPHYHFTEETFKDALRYLHKNKRIFFYEKEFPGRVIGEPQAILNKHTQIVVYHIQLSTDPEMQKSIGMRWWKFIKYGILTIDCLKKFPDHYVEGVFTPADMMKLFVKLLIVSEVSNGEYLMPCVLPSDPITTSCNPEPDTQSVPPMVLHFPGGPARYGVFCGTICHVITKSKWELVKKENGEPFHITRNSVHFSLPGYRSKVTINDSFDSFFVVTIHVPGDVAAYSKAVSCLCIEVRDTLLEAITRVTKKLNYDPGTPNVAFLCEKHDGLHPATVDVTGDELLCTKVKNTKGGLLTAGHKVWLAPPSVTSSQTVRWPLLDNVKNQVAPSDAQLVRQVDCNSQSEGANPPAPTRPNFSSYVSSLPASVCPHLKLELDWGHDGVERDLSEIADHMLNWEEKLTTHLELTPIDTNDIKKIHPFEPVLQRREALRRWKNRQAYKATYENLLQLFVRANHTQCAEAVCQVLRKRMHES